MKINFNRIYDFRPGYGYAGLKDKFYDVNTPEDDGVFLVDTVTGKEARILRAYSMTVDIVDMRCDLHARFNEDGTKVSFDSTHEEKRGVYEFDFEPEKFF